MFRQIARRAQIGFESRAEALFRLHPLLLAAMLEHGWARRRHDRDRPAGHPDRRSDLDAVPDALVEPVLRAAGIELPVLAAGEVGQSRSTVRWEHLIYAHMIENTGVFEIFEKVLHRYVHGNLDGVHLTPDSQAWLRSTEELFYRNPPGLSIAAVASDVRPDLRAMRRNAYWRMFGMDLIHGKGGEGKPYPYERPQVANTDFQDTWRQLLREVWVGISNQGNTSGPKETDDATLLDLVEKLHDMLITRRREGQLAREEFHAVSMMTWFHLTLEFDSPIVRALGASASGPEERLIKIASFVGEQIGDKKRRLDSLFDLADPMSSVLILIESKIFDEVNVPALYTPGALEADMKQIIRAWSTATGDNIKGRIAVPRIAGETAPV
jgi:hypothetical protein